MELTDISGPTLIRIHGIQMRLIHFIQIAKSVQQQFPLALRLHRVLCRVGLAVGVDLLREHGVQMGHLK